MIKLFYITRDYKYTAVCLSAIVFLFVCCQKQKDHFIDYIKISDATYLGVSEVANALDVPWDIQFNDELNSLFVTEIKGAISRIDIETGIKKQIFTIPNVFHKRTLGLLGMVLHPDFSTNPFIYVVTKTSNNVIIMCITPIFLADTNRCFYSTTNFTLFSPILAK